MGKLILILTLLFLNNLASYSQSITQTLKGSVTDKETRMPLAGANIIILDSSPPAGTTTDSDGKFRIISETGRISIRISFLGYEDLIINNIFIASGKEVNINAGLQEKVVSTQEIYIRAVQNNKSNLNPMASISAHTIRTEDAMHYAGGFYDPSRIVNSFAGIITSNSDYSNDIVIRGNSSRGLLWRLEGIEIPNPNHFSDGQGGSGGAFSAITSNVIDNFDFFTGAFPAEFGNAFSGVMDLNLRKGNTDKREYAFQTGMIGAELSMEGPFNKKTNASYLLNARFTNFKILNDLNLIDLQETNYAPRTEDLVLNINLPTKKSGNFNFFGLYGSSALGKIASHDINRWNSLQDQWEELDQQSSLTAGLKYLYILPNSRSFIKSVIAYTYYSDSYSEGYVDSTFIRTDSYYSRYSYPSLRYSFMGNHKLNARHSLRLGFYFNHLTATMANFKKVSDNVFDTLVAPYAEGNLLQEYVQWKYRVTNNLELNTGFHILHFNINHQTSYEPRLGLRWQTGKRSAIIAGLGLHTRTEALSVYYANIKSTAGVRSPENNEMDFSKSFHYVTGIDISMRNDIQIHVEAYYQHLYNIPIVNKLTSQYSTINSAESLPDAILENAGIGYNRGVELTFEKAFTKNYFFLLTGSFFNSRYKAGDLQWYNTYYNTRFVSNLLLGKDFPVGNKKRNSIGINAKYIIRGGYRYTPVDEVKSLKAKRIISAVSMTYLNQLPSFMRLDAGVNFRRNNPRYSWILMLDVQNATNRKNVFRKKFSYENGQIVTRNILSLGIVPVFNFRVEF
jgi:hypothetical protein